MSDVKVYFCSLSGVQLGPNTTPVVLASDFKALAQELAAARALLDEAYGHLRYSTADLEARIYKLLADEVKP